MIIITVKVELRWELLPTELSNQNFFSNKIKKKAATMIIMVIINNKNNININNLMSVKMSRKKHSRQAM